MTFAPQREEAVGTINNIISRSIVQRVYNDGDNTYLTIQQESRNSTPIVSTSSTLIVPLTNPNVDFVQFDKSFIRLNAIIKLNVSGYQPKSTLLQEETVVDNPTVDADTVLRGIKLFIGLKNSSDFIQEYAVYHKGKQIAGTLQSNATVESFLYHASRPQIETLNKPGIHSVAEKVAAGDDTSACGCFVDLEDLQTAVADTHTIDINLQISIPFNDILIFQQFQTYPASLFGDLELRFKVNPNALVCLQCNPLDTLKRRAIRLRTSVLKKIVNEVEILAQEYTHEYTQLGDTFNAITHAGKTEGTADILNGYQKINLATGDVSLSYNSINIENCFATIIGYRAKPESLEKMRQKFEKLPFVKFSQNINYLQFAHKASSAGFNCSQQIYLNNTTDMILLFPTTSHEAGGTVYKNPMLKDLSLTAMNRKFPEAGFQSTSHEFVNIALNSIRGMPQKEVVDSFATPRWDDEEVYRLELDATSFFCPFKVERPTAMGLICDGLDSKGYQVPIRLMAAPLEYSQYDGYCYASETNKTVPPPILITVNDSYFVFNSKDGGQCIYSNRPFNETVATFMSQ